MCQEGGGRILILRGEGNFETSGELKNSFSAGKGWWSEALKGKFVSKQRIFKNGYILN